MERQAYALSLRSLRRRSSWWRAKDAQRLLAGIAAWSKSHDAHIHQLSVLPSRIHLVVRAHTRPRPWPTAASARVVRLGWNALRVCVSGELAAYRAGLVTTPTAHRWSTVALHCGAPRVIEPAIQRMWRPGPWFVALGDTLAVRQARYRLLLGMSAGDASGDRPAFAPPVGRGFNPRRAPSTYYRSACRCAFGQR